MHKDPAVWAGQLGEHREGKALGVVLEHDGCLSREGQNSFSCTVALTLVCVTYDHEWCYSFYLCMKRSLNSQINLMWHRQSISMALSTHKWKIWAPAQVWLQNQLFPWLRRIESSPCLSARTFWPSSQLRWNFWRERKKWNFKIHLAKFSS